MQQRIRFCTSSDGVRIAYATSGTGPPLVKAANWLSHLEFDWSSPVWRHWLTSLSEHHTLIRYDQRGCGLSDCDVDTLSLEAWIRDLESVVDTLKLERFPLLGLSRGGCVALSYAVRHPEKVSHLILYGSFARGRKSRSLTKQQSDEADALIAIMRTGWGRDNPAFRQLFTTLFMPEATPEQAQSFNDLQRISSSPDNAANMAAVDYALDITDIAKQVRVPTLVLHAVGDGLVPFEEGRRLAALIPDARFVALDGKNHILMEDEPAWERFLTEVYTFLDVDEFSPVPEALSPAHDPLALTRREREVAALVGRGKSNREIADALVVSERTVEWHTGNILSKLDLQSRSQIATWAVQQGLVAQVTDAHPR